LNALFGARPQRRGEWLAPTPPPLLRMTPPGKAAPSTPTLEEQAQMSTEDSNFPVVSKGEIGGDLIQTVDARALHAFMKVGKDFSTWIKDRIDQYEFAEGVDFVSFDTAPQNGGAGNRGARKEYALAIDMAKELAMVERNEQGKKARLHFIDCERRAKDPMSALNDPAAMRGLLLTFTEKCIALEGQLAEATPKLQALERIAESDGSLCVTDAAKTLQARPKDLFAFLRGRKWLYSRAGGSEVAYQDKLQSGLLEHKTTTVHRTDGTEKTVTQVRVTPKGLTVLAQHFSGH
jgi:anti-repressor protein